MIEVDESPSPMQFKEGLQLVDIGECTPIIELKRLKRVCKWNVNRTI